MKSREALDELLEARWFYQTLKAHYDSDVYGICKALAWLNGDKPPYKFEWELDLVRRVVTVEYTTGNERAFAKGTAEFPFEFLIGDNFADWVNEQVKEKK